MEDKSVVEHFVQQLKDLRQGRGVQGLENIENLSAEFRRACGVPEDVDDALVVQEHVIRTMTDLSEKKVLNDSHRQAFRVGFNLEPGLAVKLMQRRHASPAGERNAQNLENKAIGVVANELARRVGGGRGQFALQAAMKQDITAAAPQIPRSGLEIDRAHPQFPNLQVDGWRWESLNVSMAIQWFNLARVVEEHTFIATADGVDRIGFFPALRGSPSGPTSISDRRARDWLTSQASIAGENSGTHHSVGVGKHYLQYDLGRVLASGEQYDFREAYNQGDAIMGYVFTPVNPCSHFSIKMSLDHKFALLKPHLAVFSVSSVSPAAAQEYMAQELVLNEKKGEYKFEAEQGGDYWLQNFCWELPPDPLGPKEWKVDFSDLRPGFSYGLVLRWFDGKLYTAEERKEIYARLEKARSQPDVAESGLVLHRQRTK